MVQSRGLPRKWDGVWTSGAGRQPGQPPRATALMWNCGAEFPGVCSAATCLTASGEPLSTNESAIPLRMNIIPTTLPTAQAKIFKVLRSSMVEFQVPVQEHKRLFIEKVRTRTVISNRNLQFRGGCFASCGT
jgi:hypothetical protein